MNFSGGESTFSHSGYFYGKIEMNGNSPNLYQPLAWIQQ